MEGRGHGVSWAGDRKGWWPQWWLTPAASKQPWANSSSSLGRGSRLSWQHVGFALWILSSRHSLKKDTLALLKIAGIKKYESTKIAKTFESMSSPHFHTCTLKKKLWKIQVQQRLWYCIRNSEWCLYTRY